MPPAKTITVMVGPTGQGKSTLGNMLVGGGHGFQPFTTSDDFDSETLEASHADFMLDGNTHRAIDTIGFLDTRMGSAENADKFAGFADRAPGGIDVFLFVLKKGRFTEASFGQITAFRAIAGEDALNHCILVFTHCGSESSEALRERCRASTNSHLKQAVEAVVDVIGVDSIMPDRCGDDRAAILDAIQETVRHNNGRRYENATLNEARQRRAELAEAIKGLTKERRQAMEEKLDGLYHGRCTFEAAQKALQDALERDEEERKAESERVSLQALLASAKSEAQAWREVARTVLRNAQGSGASQWSSLACCQPPPRGGTYDPGEIIDVGGGGGGMMMGDAMMAGPPVAYPPAPASSSRR